MATGTERVGYSTQFTNEAKAPNAPNNLWRPVGGPGTVRGSFTAVPFEPLTWVRERPPVRRALTAVGLAAIAFPIVGFALRAAFGGCPEQDSD